jgi:hypothetical protein
MLPCAASVELSRLAFIETGDVRSDSLTNTRLRLQPALEGKPATGKLGSCLASQLRESSKYSSRSPNSVTLSNATTPESCGFLLLLPVLLPSYQC